MKYLIAIVFSMSAYFGKCQQVRKVELKYRFTLKDTLGQTTDYLGGGKVKVKMTAPSDLTEMTGGLIVFGEKAVNMFVKTGPMRKGQSKTYVFDVSTIKPIGNEPLNIRRLQPVVYTGPYGEDDPPVIWLEKDSTLQYVYKGDGYYDLIVTADKDVSESTYEIQALFPRDTTFEFKTGPMKKGDKKTFTFQPFKYQKLRRG